MAGSLLRKARKALRCLPDPLWRRALPMGVAPSFEHAALLATLPPPRTVLDIGANVGQFALLALRAFPEARIHSFEPIPKAADTFAAATRGEARVTLHRTALGRAASEAEIHLTAALDSSSLLAPGLQSRIFPGTDAVGTITVPVARLDAVLAPDTLEGPVLMKIDVQGFEAEVLAGATGLLDRIDRIFVELSFVELYEGQPLAHEILGWLAARDFLLDGVYTGEHAYAGGRAVQADFLFRRRGVAAR